MWGNVLSDMKSCHDCSAGMFSIFVLRVFRILESSAIRRFAHWTRPPGFHPGCRSLPSPLVDLGSPTQDPSVLICVLVTRFHYGQPQPLAGSQTVNWISLPPFRDTGRATAGDRACCFSPPLVTPRVSMPHGL